MADSRARRTPWLAEPYKAGATGFVVVIGAVLAELIGGAVTNQMSTPVVLPVLAVPVVVALGFAAVQWWQVRSSGAEPASWWHLAAIAAALLTWVFWPTKPGVLDGVGNPVAACVAVGASQTPGCLPRAAQALNSHDIAWWCTAALIVALALFVRRSRIAVWAAIPVAFAGCELATHFMEQLILAYRACPESLGAGGVRLRRFRRFGQWGVCAGGRADGGAPGRVRVHGGQERMTWVTSRGGPGR